MNAFCVFPSSFFLSLVLSIGSYACRSLRCWLCRVGCAELLNTHVMLRSQLFSYSTRSGCYALDFTKLAIPPWCRALNFFKYLAVFMLRSEKERCPTGQVWQKRSSFGNCKGIFSTMKRENLGDYNESSISPQCMAIFVHGPMVGSRHHAVYSSLPYVCDLHILKQLDGPRFPVKARGAKATAEATQLQGSQVSMEDTAPWNFQQTEGRAGSSHLRSNLTIDTVYRYSCLCCENTSYLGAVVAILCLPSFVVRHCKALGRKLSSMRGTRWINTTTALQLFGSEHGGQLGQ